MVLASQNIIEEIKKLKREKNAIILGHNYMEYGVQLVSDFTGDSYDLAVKAMKTNADIIVFAGVYFMAEQAAALNPESPLEVLESADFVGSTNQMIKFAKESQYKEFIVATELGMINALKLQVPDKVFYPLVTTEACACARCPYMAMITLEKIKNSLEHEVYEVKVPRDVAERAKMSFENTMRLLSDNS
jgi:quinolinate synthase